MPTTPTPGTPTSGTPTRSPLRFSPHLFASPHARRVSQPVASIDARGNLALNPCHRGPQCIRGQFVVGDLYADNLINRLDAEGVQDTTFFKNERHVLPLRLTINPNPHFSSLRFGFSSGLYLPHSRFVLPDDQGVCWYDQEKSLGAAVVSLPELSTVQAAGTITVVVGPEGFGKVVEMTLQSGHYLTPDMIDGEVDQNRYLSRIVKSWQAFYGNCDQLLGATLRDIEEQELGQVDEDLVEILLHLHDPGFEPQPRKASGVFQARRGAETRVEQEIECADIPELNLGASVGSLGSGGGKAVGSRHEVRSAVSSEHARARRFNPLGLSTSRRSVFAQHRARVNALFAEAVSPETSSKL